jgi:flagellar motor switch protein FliM
LRKTLDQNEIDALFSKVQAFQNPVSSKPSKKIVRCDLRRTNQLRTDQIVAVTKLHESFANLLSSSLGAHLRVAFHMNLVSAEQLMYSEFLSRLPDLNYAASLHVMPIDARAIIQLDIALVYPIIDTVLGGSGMETIEPRDLTEIEGQILETVVRLIVQDLQSTWATLLNLEFQCELRLRGVQLQNMMPREEKILCLRFEIRLAETSGCLTLVFPAAISNSLLRKLSVQWAYSERMPSRNSRRHIREQLQDSHFMAELCLPISPLAVRQFMNLEPGQVLMLPKSAREPIHLNIAGKPMFMAYPVRQGPRRSARIEKRISIASSNTKEPL